MRPLMFVAILVAAACVMITPGSTEPIGKTVRVLDNLTGPSGKLITGDAIHFGDQLSTDQSGLGQILFRDGSKLVLGPDATLTIDDAVYKEDSTFGQLVLSTLKGAFRWISGRSQSSAYKIKTSWATLAVRGTAFDLFVAPTGGIAVVLYEGAVTVCLNSGGECRTIKGRCRLVTSERPGDLSGVKRVKHQVASMLPNGLALSLISNDELLEPFRISGSNCKVRRSKKAATSTRKTAKKVAQLSTKTTKKARKATIAKRPVVTSKVAAVSGKLRSNKSTPGTVVSSGAVPSGLPSPGSAQGQTAGNPGNNKAKGNAGEAPNGGDFGGGTKGASDSGSKGQGKGNGNGSKKN